MPSRRRFKSYLKKGVGAIDSKNHEKTPFSRRKQPPFPPVPQTNHLHFTLQSETEKSIIRFTAPGPIHGELHLRTNYKKRFGPTLNQTQLHNQRPKPPTTFM
jgi:hypothetical protein